MAKKTEEIEAEAQVSSIAEITADFGRADLNELASKLNEVIRAINK